MKLQIFSSFREFESKAKEWDCFVEQYPLFRFFYSSPFIRTWAKTFGCDNTLRIAIGYEKGKITAALPLYEDTPGTWNQIGKGMSDYSGLLASENSEEFWRLLSKHSGWETIHLNYVPAAHVGTLPSLRYERRGKWTQLLPLTATEFPCAFSVCSQSHPYLTKAALVEFQKGYPSPHFRKLQKAASKVGVLEYFHAKPTAEDLDGFFSLWRRSSQVETCARELDLEMDSLRLNGRLIAAHLGFSKGDRRSWYLPVFDSEFAELSPGTLLLAHALADAATSECEVFDFLSGREAYKDRFSDAVAETMSVTVFRNAEAVRGMLREKMVSKLTDWSQIHHFPAWRNGANGIRMGQSLD